MNNTISVAIHCEGRRLKMYRFKDPVLGVRPVVGLLGEEDPVIQVTSQVPSRVLVTLNVRGKKVGSWKLGYEGTIEVAGPRVGIKKGYTVEAYISWDRHGIYKSEIRVEIWPWGELLKWLKKENPEAEDFPRFAEPEGHNLWQKIAAIFSR